MTPEELQRVKDIAVEFQDWVHQNTYFYPNRKAYLAETGEIMTMEDLFDYFVHEILTEIEIDSLNPKD